MRLLNIINKMIKSKVIELDNYDSNLLNILDENNIRYISYNYDNENILKIFYEDENKISKILNNYRNKGD
jgi:hypothetical protein